MSSHTCIVAAMFVLLFNATVARAQQPPTAKATEAQSCDSDDARRRVCAVDDSLRVALVDADTATLARLYADDLLTINYRGVQSTKDVLLRVVGNGTLQFDTLRVHARTVEIHLDTAVVHGTMHQVARGAEGAHPLEVDYQRTYVRRGSSWQLIRAALTASAAPNRDRPLRQEPR